MKRVIYALLLTISAFLFGHAQSSYMAGNMRIIQEDAPEANLTLEARVQLISPIDSPVEDSIPVFWGDGSSGWLLLPSQTVLYQHPYVSCQSILYHYFTRLLFL
jgi:hypothetical protein